MNNEIKMRIEDINNGEVPNNYIKTRAGIMPLDWTGLKASKIFKSATNKKHNGEFEVLSATQDRGIIPRSKVDIDIKYAEESIGGYKKVDVGDFVISLRSFQGGIEYSAYQGLVSPAYTVLKPILPINYEFFKYYFKTTDFIQRLNSTIYGIRDGKQIGYDDFGELILHYPSIAEQNKIADILKRCDKVISLKQQLIEEKKKRKKWLMQNLLDPDSGVRLAGFEGEWDRPKLGEVIKVSSGNALPIEFISSKGFPVYGGNGVSGYSSKFNMNGSQIIIGRVGANCGCVYHTEGPIWVTDNALVIREQKRKLHEPFFAYALNNINLNKYADKNAQPLVSGKKIYSIEVSLPQQLSEQKAISDFFLVADREISLDEKELFELESKKKALMQLLLSGIVRIKN